MVVRVASGRGARRGGHPGHPTLLWYAMMWSGRFQRGEAGIQVKCFTSRVSFFLALCALLLRGLRSPRVRTTRLTNGLTDLGKEWNGFVWKGKQRE